MPIHSRPAVLLSAALMNAVFGAHAQTPPDAGKLLREVQKAQEPPPPEPPAATSPASAAESTTGPRVQVKSFLVTGVSLLPEAELQARLAPLVGQSASLADLRRATEQVAAHYQAAGYLVRAYLPEQTLRDGVVTIAVLEGRLAAVLVEQAPPGRHIAKERVEAMMTARQKIGAPVRADDVQRAIGLLNALPGLSASSLLQPGQQPGETTLLVSVKDEPAFGGQVQADNSGSKATGEWRVSGGLSWNSPLGMGDQAMLFASKSSGSTFGSLSYSAPLGVDGWRGGFNASRLSYDYTLSGSRYDGGADTVGALLNYPLLRSQRANLGLVASLDRKAFDNAVAGIQINDKTISLAGLGLGGDVADEFFSGGITQASVTLNWGRLNLSRNAADLAADRITGGPNRQGSFRKLSFSLGRVQRVSRADSLLVNLSGQWASRNLDSAEKFSITGSNGVRAYSSAEPSGDEGALLGLEWRHQINDQLTLSAFHDHARIKRDKRSNAATLSPNSYSLGSNGLGFSWGRASTVLIRGAVAWRVGDNPVRNPATGADSDGSSRNPRVFVSLLKVF
jgi:hemolysin activation/secretion protein